MGRGREILRTFRSYNSCPLSQRDKFDETKGRRIAESKAKRLVYSEGIQRGRMILKAENAYRKELETFVENTVKYKEKEVAHTSIVMG